MSPKKHGNSSISVGNIEDSVGVAIGHGSSVSVHQTRSPAQEEIIALLEEFIRSLGSYGNSLSDAREVRESAIAACAEAAEPSPRWHVVRGLLKGIGASVASVAALTDAINNIQVLVAHIVG